jgi:hypothetical protein
MSILSNAYAPARTKPKGLVLWSGPSNLDGSPVVVIATGFRGTSNPKTGQMLQTWILPADVSPVRAIYSGADASTCGNCPMRGDCGRGRSCYVAVHRAPQAIWKAYRRGRYLTYTPREHNRFLRGRFIRLGAYGDPCAAPYSLWARLCRLSKRWTGYTHQWRQPRLWRFRWLTMASVESAEDHLTARARGWRTFRTTLPGVLPLPTEQACPAAKENGARVQCIDCCACQGTRFDQKTTMRSRMIWAHGGPAAIANYRRLIGDDDK